MDKYTNSSTSCIISVVPELEEACASPGDLASEKWALRYHLSPPAGQGPNEFHCGEWGSLWCFISSTGASGAVCGVRSVPLGGVGLFVVSVK